MDDPPDHLTKISSVFRFLFYEKREPSTFYFYFSFLSLIDFLKLKTNNFSHLFSLFDDHISSRKGRTCVV